MKKRDIIHAMKETRDAFEMTVRWLDREIETAEDEKTEAYLIGKKTARIADINLIDEKLEIIKAAEKEHG